MSLRVAHLNPDGLPVNPAFSQAVAVEGAARTIYVGGQNAVTADGTVTGVGDLAAQTEQVFRNLERVLTAAGADLHDIVKWTIYAIHGQDARPALEVFRRVWGAAPPPAISVVGVAGLARPDFLLEIEAIAVAGAARAAGAAGREA